MPNMLALVDRVDRFLSPSGLLSVCDFYVSAREKTSLSEIIGDVASRHCSWLTRLFWLHWSVNSTSASLRRADLPFLSGSSSTTSTSTLRGVSTLSIRSLPSSLSTAGESSCKNPQKRGGSCLDGRTSTRHGSRSIAESLSRLVVQEQLCSSLGHPHVS